MSTRILREQQVYEQAQVDERTGELVDFDDVIYPAVIRQRQHDLMRQVAGLTNPRRILDVACGGGWSTRFLAGLTSHAIGVDVSRNLVSTARGMAPPNTEFVLGDGNRLPFKEHSIDLLVSVAALHHLEPERALNEWRKVMAPAGRLLLFEPNRLNPLGAIGRKFFPFDTHTSDERPFTPSELKSVLRRCAWRLLYWSTDIHFAFVASRMLRLHSLSRSIVKETVPFFLGLEQIARKLPFTRDLGWVIAGIAQPVTS